MAELLGRPLSDGSYWTIDLNIAPAASSPTHCPPEGLFKMDLCFSRTCLVEYEDEGGHPSHSQEFGIFQTVVPTLHLPGTMNRAEYYTALHQWLQSLDTHHYLPLEGDVVNDFTDHVIERVSGTVDLREKVAIWVHADLHLVSRDYDYFPMESEPDHETEYIEEEDGEENVQRLSEFFRVIAGEEHRRFGDCSICLEGLVPVGEAISENYLFVSPCGHFFHSECMEKWLRMSYSCPLCRFDMAQLGD